jgi:hypothetical protein
LHQCLPIASRSLATSVGIFLCDRSKKLDLLLPYFVLLVAGVWACVVHVLFGVPQLPETVEKWRLFMRTLQQHSA